MKKELQFRTFDELLDEVRIDFPMHELEGLIEPQQLIKVAQRINNDLGLRIHQTRECFIDIEHYNARLPDDFYTMNFAYAVWQYTEYETNFLPGLHREFNVVDIAASAVGDCPSCYVACGCNSCCPEGPAGANGLPTTVDCTRVVQVTDITPSCYCVRDYRYTHRIYLEKSKYTTPDCNPNCNYHYIGQIKDGFLYTPEIECGKVFISYQGAMVDYEGNLMLIDNPIINEYYEWGCKKAILESMYFSNEDVARQLEYCNREYREARHKAQSYVNMPNFADLKKVWELNRAAMYKVYIHPFTSHFVDSYHIPNGGFL